MTEIPSVLSKMQNITISYCDVVIVYHSCLSKYVLKSISFLPKGLAWVSNTTPSSLFAFGFFMVFKFSLFCFNLYSEKSKGEFIILLNSLALCLSGIISLAARQSWRNISGVYQWILAFIEWCIKLLALFFLMEFTHVPSIFRWMWNIIIP